MGAGGSDGGRVALAPAPAAAAGERSRAAALRVGPLAARLPVVKALRLLLLVDLAAERAGAFSLDSALARADADGGDGYVACDCRKAANHSMPGACSWMVKFEANFCGDHITDPTWPGDGYFWEDTVLKAIHLYHRICVPNPVAPPRASLATATGVAVAESLWGRGYADLVDRLHAVATAASGSFRARRAAGAPYFGYEVLDGVLPSEVVGAVVEEVRSLPRCDVLRSASLSVGTAVSREKGMKLVVSDARLMGPSTRMLLSFLSSSAFVGFLERLTGISGLLPDPSNFGSALHFVARGGLLDLHYDFHRLASLGLERRLNALLYLNEDWDPSYGGHLELWRGELDGEGHPVDTVDVAAGPGAAEGPPVTVEGSVPSIGGWRARRLRCLARVRPAAGRLVVFETTDFSFHGHPHPLRCPGDRFRTGIALFYYTNGRPAGEVADDAARPEWTAWLKVPCSGPDDPKCYEGTRLYD
eukprot:TRINITY_DN22017_c0_g1_i1.p1 TRINITY_DN22017_c0_g1~~TRINITY_DN22017_c0_g1_i1.p1  ORF type:complete len:474 (+),score=104.08 TRINITY_DN22017_c0_g1_i1:46-1467(+)